MKKSILLIAVVGFMLSFTKAEAVLGCFNFSFAFGTKEEAEEGTHEGCVGQIFIDQEIE